jgi:Effector-associated domain 11
MQIERLRDKWKQETITNLPNAFKDINNHLSKSSDVFNGFCILYGDFSDWRDNNIKGIAENEALSKRQIRDRLLKFIDELNQEHILVTADLPDTINEKILVICADSERQKVMSKFFGSYYFQNVSYRVNEPFSIPAADTDLIILDRATEDNDYDKLLEQYMNQSFLFVCLTPKNWGILMEKRDKVNIANSKLSLYARIKEVLDYIKYYGK